MENPELGERLRFLQQNVYPVGKQPFTLPEIQDSLAPQGITVSLDELEATFAGHHQPSFTLMNALAQFFRVSITVFSNDTDWENARSWIMAMRDRVGHQQLAASRALRRREERLARKRDQL